MLKRRVPLSLEEDAPMLPIKPSTPENFSHRSKPPASAGRIQFKFVLGRPSVSLVCTRCDDLGIDAAMGYNTWAAFQGTSERAAVCGDFAMLEEEVRSVIRELQAGDIEVVAVHNHMFFEEPRIVFLHYWGVASAEELAKTFKCALDTQH
jgi:uncharacterized protein DUF1259